MANWIFVVFALCLFHRIQAHINYCSNSYCNNGYQNVGCNPPVVPGGFECYGKSPAVVTLTSGQQTLILNEHNTRRSQLALGNLRPFLSAKRMPTLTWDTELAKQAGNNARSCVFAHDKCRNTPVYSWAGQNLYIARFYGMTKTIEVLLQEGISGWWNEYTVTAQAFMNRYPNNYKGPAIGHFTQMASDQSNKVGCAMQYWLDGSFKTYYLVCNYGVTNVIGRPVYKRGVTHRSKNPKSYKTRSIPFPKCGVTPYPKPRKTRRALS